MDQDTRNRGDISHQMDSPPGLNNQTRGSNGFHMILNTDNVGTDRMVPGNSILGSGGRDPTTNWTMRNVDGEGNISTLPSKDHGHLHVAAPSPFN
jgi:hypothetical protein